MATLRELIYMVSDELKLNSDDSYFNEEHIAFLLGNYRTFLLRTHYKDVKKEVPQSNFQILCLDLIQVPAIAGVPCEGGILLRSKEQIPTPMTLSSPKILTDATFGSWHIAYVSKERMQFVGYNKWLKNIIYASLGPDNYLYLNSTNAQFLHLEKLRISAVFEDSKAAYEFQCGGDNACDYYDNRFPLEEGLIPQLIELTVKELTRPKYSPEDTKNDANDNMSDVGQTTKNNG